MTASDDEVEAFGARLQERVESMRQAGPPADEGALARASERAAAAALRMEQARRREQWRQAIPSRFQWASLDYFAGVEAGTPSGPVQVGPTLAAWGADPAGRNLVLVGATGVGKTFAAVAAARVAHDAGHHVRFMPVVELLDALRPGAPADTASLDELMGVDVLILDDLGAERATDWTAERLFSLVNRRWMEEQVTIATTNLEPAELAAAVGERTYSRLVGSDSVVLRLAGQDRRRRG